MTDPISRESSQDGFEIREMTEVDLPGVERVDRGSFEAPWPIASLRGELERAGARRWCYVAEADGQIIGYLLAFQAADELHVARIAVSPSRRRHGMARALMNVVLASGSGSGIAAVWLEVRESNAAARSLYAALGFEEALVRRAYYHDARGAEDAVVLVRWVRD